MTHFRVLLLLFALSVALVGGATADVPDASQSSKVESAPADNYAAQGDASLFESRLSKALALALIVVLLAHWPEGLARGMLERMVRRK